MITRRIPTEVPVPKLSVHWSTPWPHDEYAAASKRWTEGVVYKRRGRDVRITGPTIWGKEPDWEHARKIRFRGESIRVFPHEFSEMTNEKMRVLIDGGALELRAQDDVPTDPPIDKTLIGEQKVIYEEALVAGCDHAQAMMVCFGIDPTIPDAEFPPVGWYKCAPQYAVFFCEDWELEPEDADLLDGAEVAIGNEEPVAVVVCKSKVRRKKRSTRKKAARRPSERRSPAPVSEYTPTPELSPLTALAEDTGSLLDAYLADPDGTMAKLTKAANQATTKDNDDDLYMAHNNGWLDRRGRFAPCLYGLHATVAATLAGAHGLESKEVPGSDERALEEAGWAKLTKGQWMCTKTLTQSQKKFVAKWCTENNRKMPDIGD